MLNWILGCIMGIGFGYIEGWSLFEIVQITCLTAIFYNTLVKK